MRKAGHIQAPPEVVSRMFSNVQRWTAWMPGVRSVRVLEEREDEVIALVQQRWFGRELDQKWALSIQEGGLLQRQLEGSFKKWEMAWSFTPPPDQDGTTIMVDIRFDLGLLGRFTPGWVIEDTLDRMFEEVVDKAEARARAILAGDTLSAPIAFNLSDALLRVFQTDQGLELEFAGRRFLIEAIKND